MRFLYFDIDTLRADHLGCYGYHRNTSPNIDRIAEEGMRFDNCYASDTPCLPSRSSLFSGRFGIHTGVINHGGINADMRVEGGSRGFVQNPDLWHWPMVFKQNGYHTVSVSPFAERHSAWWFYNGFKEMYNPGRCGHEIADEVLVYAEKWLKENGMKDKWFLHINVWDPHTPYRVPEEYGNPFKDEPVGSWHTRELLEKNYRSYGPHSPQDLGGFDYAEGADRLARVVKEIKTMEDYKKWIDGYDVGIRYADEALGRVLRILEEDGVLEETVIIISSDHGESQGELNVYGDHQTADNMVNRVPFILRWPGLLKGGSVNKGLYYQVDLGASILEIGGMGVPRGWDGRSYAENIRKGISKGREYLVISHCAWSCQRSVVYDGWLLIRTYDTGLKAYPEIMLFNIEEDPHLLRDVAKERDDVVNKGIRLLEEWHSEMMRKEPVEKDPLWEVIREGGPFHTRSNIEKYIRRLEATGRKEGAEILRKYKGKPVTRFAC